MLKHIFSVQCPPPYMRHSIPLFEGSRASPVFPADKSNIKMNRSMEHWWNDSDGVKTEVLGDRLVPVPLCPP
jgi:hypothetical protein